MASGYGEGLSMERLAMLLEGEGLEVYWYQEGDREEFGEFPVISFGGDNDEEMRALRLGWQHGYYPERIEKG